MRIAQSLRRITPQPRFLLPLTCAAFSVLMWFALSAYAAQTTPSHSSPQQQEQKASANSSDHNSLNRQLIQQTREAAGEEDDQSKFKHSGAVQFIAKITGLSTEEASGLCFLLNFAIVAVAIVWFMKKNLPGVFRKRTASIQKAMEEARKASEDARRRLSEIEARLSRLDIEISEIRAVADKDAAAEEQRIKAAAEEDARKIVESVEQEIAAAAKAARRELTAYAADLAVSLARKQIHVDATTDQALVRNFAQQLSSQSEDLREH